MTLRALTSLLLALMLTVTSVGTAAAQARMIGAMQVELCADHGAGSVVTLDAAGNPIDAPRHCPDCLAATMAPGEGAVRLPRPPLGRGETRLCRVALPPPCDGGPEPAARGPPLPV